MAAHQLMPRRWIRLAFFLARHIAPELLARVPQGMLGDQAVKPPLHRIRQSIVSGARIGKLRIASVSRNHLGMQHRPGCRFLPEGAVGMPELVASHKCCAPIVVTKDAAILVEIGNIEYFPVLYPRIGSGRPGFSPNA